MPAGSPADGASSAGGRSFLGFHLISDGAQGVGQRLAVRALELAGFAVGQLGVLRVLGWGDDDDCCHVTDLPLVLGLGLERRWPANSAPDRLPCGSDPRTAP